MATLSVTLISIHAPARGATKCRICTRCTARDFNPRTREGCDPSGCPHCFSPTYFNPRTREGCDATNTGDWSAAIVISIHAPARGATKWGFNQVYRWDISIHAPARGATLHSVIFTEAVTDFNPRTREGCDGSGDVQDPAPGNFNPRTREGCDQGGKFIGRFYSHFNPRTREGCDTNAAVLSFQKWISIHAPARGATFCVLYKVIIFPISIHAPARGATVTNSQASNLAVDFNPRTREGCDRAGRLADAFCQIRFQSTHPRGVRRAGNDEKINLRSISIHAPARGATAIFTKFFIFLTAFLPILRSFF